MSAETIEPTTCAKHTRIQTLGSGTEYAERCNRPGVQLCEKHLEDERHTAQRGYDELRRAYEQIRMVLNELVVRVESNATAKVRMCAAVDAAKAVLR